MKYLFMFFALLGYVLFYSCDLVDRKNLLHIPISGNGAALDVDYVAAGATSEDVLQVTKLSSNGNSEVLKNLKPYDSIVSYHVKGDTVLCLVLCIKTNTSMPITLDTINIKIN